MIFKKTEFKNARAYKKLVGESGIFKNSVDGALPQTVIAKAVRAHLQSSGKTKKVAIIGFDGARADAIPMIVKSSCDPNISEAKYSALEKLKKEGGLYTAYTGGKETKQDTSTPQGWATVLTGKWGSENGVVKFTDRMPKADTFLYEYAKQGKKTVFNAIWPVHFTDTYINEIETAKNEKLPAEYFMCEDNDDILTEKMIKSVTEDDCDISFCIMELPDHAGHETGFGNRNPLYVKAVTLCDKNAYKIISAIESRPAYGEEDWLIIITSDHGGHLRGHGSQYITDRTIFIASNKTEYFE